jgi:sugar phosphate isomerase/epimerase
MRAGLFTDALGDRPLADALAWVAAETSEIRDVEIGTGGYSGSPHCDRAALLEDEEERRRLLAGINEAGFSLAALNASGNPLEREADAEALRDTVQLAPLLGVDRLVCMSGGSPDVAGGSWFPGLEDAHEREWADRVLPYWEELSSFAQAEHASLRLCLELEPGAAVYNVTTFERLAEVGDNVAINLDPSHLFWQGMDPLAVIARFGHRVGFAHGKDTVLHEDRVRVDGVLQRTGNVAWEYATVGRGHDGDWWRAFVEALAAAGYDGVISIEHEDELVSPEEGVREAARVLVRAMAGVAA